MPQVRALVQEGQLQDEVHIDTVQELSTVDVLNELNRDTEDRSTVLEVCPAQLADLAVQTRGAGRDPASLRHVSARDVVCSPPPISPRHLSVRTHRGQGRYVVLRLCAIHCTRTGSLANVLLVDGHVSGGVASSRQRPTAENLAEPPHTRRV